MSTFDFFGWFDKVTKAAEASPVGKILKPKGWEIAHTGGGCLAWEKTSSVAYVWITYADNELGQGLINPEAEDWCVGVYSNDGDHYSNGIDVTGITAAIAKAEAMLANPEAYYEPEFLK